MKACGRILGSELSRSEELYQVAFFRQRLGCPHLSFTDLSADHRLQATMLNLSVRRTFSQATHFAMASTD